jgi:hypothetical protein
VNVADIKARVKGIIGKEIFFYETVGSTNTVAADLFEKTSEGALYWPTVRKGKEGSAEPGFPCRRKHPHDIILRPKIELGCNPSP